MGVVTLIFLISVEIGFLIWSFKTKCRHTLEKSVVRVAEVILLVILLLTNVLEWGFRYYGILIVLIIQTIPGIIALIGKRKKVYSGKRILGLSLCCVFVYGFALSPAILFPQYTPLNVTGSHTVATAEYAWTDPDRVERFTDTGKNRFVNAAFWYPEENGKYPLVVFSHGAFGILMSNASTFTELASNGYVVASIGHPYHSFYTQDIDGKPIIADMNFINSIYTANEMEDGPEQQAIIDQWMDVRLADIHFVLNTIAQQVRNQSENSFFNKIDLDKIGLMGHSLGGAASAQIGRERQDVDAVIILDATMLGETEGFDNGTPVFNKTPYPVPLLNIYREAHYETALPYGEKYENFHAAARALCSYEVVIKNAGHMSFTELPLFSPLLAKMLDSGTIDARYGIEITNTIALEFFNYTLKNGQEPQFEKEY